MDHADGVQSAQVEPVESRRGDGRGHRPEGGVRAAARTLGVNRNEARRAVRIAGIAPEAKEAARKAGLDDNQSALLKIASYADDYQVEAVAEIVKAKAEKPKPKPATITVECDAAGDARLAEWERARAERLEAWPAVAALIEDYRDDFNRLRPDELLEFATHVVTDSAPGLPELFVVIKPTLDDFHTETVARVLPDGGGLSDRAYQGR